jgi:hypothetical protein
MGVKEMNKLIIIAIIALLALFFVAPAFATIGDINGDGKVDLKDAVLLAGAYGSRPGEAKWDARCDLDGNGAVGLSDLVTLAYHYGEPHP